MKRFHMRILFAAALGLATTGCGLSRQDGDNGLAVGGGTSHKYLIDRGEGYALGAGGRAVISTWHAGPDRGEQAVCVEPDPERGEAAFVRFEACLAYANGLLTAEEYESRITP